VLPELHTWEGTRGAKQGDRHFSGTRFDVPACQLHSGFTLDGWHMKLEPKSGDTVPSRRNAAATVGAGVFAHAMLTPAHWAWARPRRAPRWCMR
jgi:hypothetical protein